MQKRAFGRVFFVLKMNVIHEELLDVLNSDGSPAGRAKPKSAVHRDGDWHRAVHIWIVTPDDRIPLQRRSRTKVTYPGLWDVSCAGHLSAGESPRTAAVRELEEELGLGAAEPDLEELGTIVEAARFDAGRYLENEFQTTFILRRIVDPERLTLQSEEVEEAMLVTLGDFAASVARRDTAITPHWKGYELLFAALRTHD